MLERAAADGSPLTQQIALPRMARFSSLSATIMYFFPVFPVFPDGESGKLRVNTRPLMIPNGVLR
jgi:hypothetical protein